MQQTFSIYVHYPFCLRRCPYCAFYSTELTDSEIIRAYPDLIMRELVLRSPDWSGFLLKSIYIGGGTPSLMSAAEVNAIITAILARYTPVDNLEISLEANPGTLSRSSVEDFIKAGINRLSLGIQSFSDERLSFLGRIHSKSEAVEALSEARRFSHLKVSVDLMVGTPLEDAGSWDAEIDTLLAYKPDGISFYSLTLEEGTKLAARERGGELVNLPTDVTVDLMLHVAGKLADAGYRHYEVSNWALPGSECRHNLHYWQRGSYLGLGPSAHSFTGRRRSWNAASLQAYRTALNGNRLPPSEAEDLNDDEIRMEWVYLKLRQASGLDLEEYRSKFGDSPPYWSKILERIGAAGLGVYTSGSFKPNDRGLLLADEIALRILG